MHQIASKSQICTASLRHSWNNPVCLGRMLLDSDGMRLVAVRVVPVEALPLRHQHRSLRTLSRVIDVRSLAQRKRVILLTLN